MVHLWCWNLYEDQGTSGVEEFLSTQERLRMRRYLFEADGRRFAAVRTKLRMVLSKATGVPPQSIELSCNDYGKPLLVGTPVHFNVSHSSELALIGLTDVGPIGVDIERIRSLEEDLFSRVCTKPEYDRFSRLSPPEHQLEFFSLWTRKEAVIKAEGKGLSIPCHSFQVPPFSEQSGRVTGGDDVLTRSWTVIRVDLGANYAGAIALPFETPIIWREKPRQS